MKILLAAVVPRRSRSKADAFETLVAEYIARSARYSPTETQLFDSETALLDWIGGQSGRVTPHVILLDSRGKQLTSEDFAATLGTLRDQGTQRLVLAVGSADGWSDHAKSRANFLISFGRMTLPHQLARVVLAEQLYRGLTILAGHPYHSGH